MKTYLMGVCFFNEKAKSVKNPFGLLSQGYFWVNAANHIGAYKIQFNNCLQWGYEMQDFTIVNINEVN